MNSIEELKKTFGEVKVDEENNCIDRSTPLGKYFEDALKAAKEEKDSNKSVFMQQVLAYAEAAMVIEASMPPEEAAKALETLKTNMATPSAN